MSVGLRAGVANDGYIQINGVDVVRLTTQGFYTGSMGQCRFQFVSTTTCVLVPCNGNLLSINGANYVIPSAGVTLASAGLTAATLYYVYALQTAGVLSLEASTTSHSTDTSTGIEVKTGDATRTLVGMVYPTVGPVFQDTGINRLVLSWFNRRRRIASISLGANVSTSSTTMVEVEPTYRVGFLSWANEDIKVTHTGSMTATIASTVTTCIFSGGVLGTGYTPAISSGTVTVASYHLPAVCLADVLQASDGYSFIGMAGSTGGGTASWFGASSTPTIRCTLTSVIEG